MLFALLSTIVWLIDRVIGLYIIVVVAAVVVSWLLAFGVLSIRNDLVRSLVQILDALTEPVFRRVRRYIPPIGGIDLSPLIVIIGLEALNYFVDMSYLRFTMGSPI